MNLKELTNSEIIKYTYEVSKELGIPVFLVGGSIRDFFLSSKPAGDFDFAVQGKVREVAALCARKAGGSFFCLDHQRGHYRVTIKEKTEFTYADFSMLQGEDITKDLSNRDFTINGMALRLTDLFESDNVQVIDPLSGMTDITKRLIRVCSSSAFKNDPLRLLRAVRIASATHFLMERETENLIREEKRFLTLSSWERIRDELFRILMEPSAGTFIEQLHDLGLLEEVFPETCSWKDIDQGGHHDHNLLDHAVKTVESVEDILNSFSACFHDSDHVALLTEHLNEELEENVTRLGLLKFTALFHDSGKVGTRSRVGEKVTFFGHEKVGGTVNETIAGRLKLGRKATRIVTKVTHNHMRILNLTRSGKITRKARYRFFRDLGKDGIECLLLSLADNTAKRSVAFHPRRSPFLSVVQGFVKYYFEDWLSMPEKPLMTGNEIMEFLGIPPGRDVGTVISSIREAEGQGLISTKDEAKALAKSTHTMINKRSTCS